jgi:hypothetical protein
VVSLDSCTTLLDLAANERSSSVKRPKDGESDMKPQAYLQMEWTEFVPPDSVTVAVTSVLRLPKATEIQTTTTLSKDSSLGYLEVMRHPEATEAKLKTHECDASSADTTR